MIRRALVKSWPALSKFFGLFPWDADRLTMDELNEYLRQFDTFHRDQARVAQRQKRTARR